MSGVALVTGASRRIGRAIAIRLAAAGFDVAAHYGASPGEAEETALAVAGLGRRSVTLQADLADPDKAAALIGKAKDALGPLTLLVNNASVFLEDRLPTMRPDVWRQQLDTNLLAPLILSQAFAAQAQAGASIVNLLDQRVLKPTPQFFSYSISKAALWFATRTMAQALAPDIRVNAVGPGPTLPSIHQAQAEFEAEAKGVPLQRRATPDEIADAVLFLARSPSITGQMILVDGGQHLGWRTPDIVQ